MAFKNLVSLALAASAILANVASANPGFERMRAQQQEQADRQYAALQQQSEIEQAEAQASTKNFRYLNNKTAPYRVTSLPDFPFNVGEMYSGLVPINNNDLSRQLFYVFAPKLGAPSNTLTIWLNGGPGCSSMPGFLQENGRFLWQEGSYPQENNYAWNNLTNMLWVEQPVGVGYSLGATGQYKTEVQIAKDFNDFFLNFEKLFGIKNYKIYVAGESYAGRYIPYISAGMLDRKDRTHFDYSGSIIYDPCIGSYGYLPMEIAVMPYVTENNNVFNLNETYLNSLNELADSCGYTRYYDNFLTFPPPSQQPVTPAFNVPPPYGVPPYSDACDVQSRALSAIQEINPCFDIHNILAECPFKSDPLSYLGPNTQVYFDRHDVKVALHAPLNVTWLECGGQVFDDGNGGPEGGGDYSPDPTQHVLPQIIEATNRVLVSNGQLDAQFPTNGTLLMLQNMTWNGKLGFQTAPTTPIVINDPYIDAADSYYDTGPQGVMGIQHFERGLMWAVTDLAGHEQPSFQPRVTYRHVQWMLGQIDTL